ncbi:MAG: hypothetical protein HQL16_04000 [Candidatus Omnitrophica bacterium]|nr:hypothetical protein [Candidatus Omnitrophota bacterium]
MGKIFKRVLALFVVVAFLGGMPCQAFAQATLDDILKRVEALEKENAALKAEVMELKNKPAPAAVVAAAPAAAAPSGNFLKTKFDMELYGFIKVDAVYSDSEAALGTAATNGAAASYNAPSNTLKKHQGDFNMSGQDIRLGINFKPAVMDDGGKVGGKFEMDFAGNPSAQATYTPRLRHAYITLDYDKWGVTAGHTWDFFAPLNTNLLNSGNAWRAGNIGHRHPQAYLTNKWGKILGGDVATKVGIIDSDDLYQENSKTPVVGVYASYDTKIMGVASNFGVGGIAGQSSTDALGTSEGNKSNDIYAVTLNSTLKFTDWLALKAEGFEGSRLDRFYVNNAVGTNNTSYNATTKGLRTIGGFMELTYNPLKKVETNFGMGIDQLMNDKNTVTSAAWSSNDTYWTNIKYSLTKDLILGLEYQRFNTNWVTGVDSTDNRVQSSLIYKF